MNDNQILVMQELSSGMRNVLPFLIRDAKSCIDCEPHKGWPRFAINASIHLTHSFACSAFSVDFLPPYRVWKSPQSETNFWKECIKARRKKKDTCASKIIPIELYTHLLCTTKIWLSFMNVVKSYLRWKIAKVFLTPSTIIVVSFIMSNWSSLFSTYCTQFPWIISNVKIKQKISSKNILRQIIEVYTT